VYRLAEADFPLLDTDFRLLETDFRFAGTDFPGTGSEFGFLRSRFGAKHGSGGTRGWRHPMGSGDDVAGGDAAAEEVDGFDDALFEGDAGFPAEEGFGAGDVGLADLGVVNGEGFVDDLGI
jgi:hypothetical protein